MVMVTSAARLVGRLTGAALKVGLQGARVVVERTAAAVKVADQLQELLAKWERTPHVRHEPAREEPEAEPVPEEAPAPARVPREQLRATAERVLEEARAVETRLREARPARHPLKAYPEMPEEAPAARATPARKGRKTTPTATAPAPRRAKAPPGGFKAKRGQKHRH